MSIRSPVSPSLSPPPPPALSPSPASGVTADDHCCCTPDPCGATASPHSKLLFLWNGHHSLGFHRADKRRTPEDTNFRPDRQRGIARRLSSLAMHMTCSTLCLVPTETERRRWRTGGVCEAGERGGGVQGRVDVDPRST
ncbi:uncharacterized protein LOC104585532 isoform X3 [Brachypodium distachyon]|uniref:uncharacterized protein LOC104585532 isoform X3 n=1 Tax=Brachypodium distachyon TaxID=15368 RepID=UPI00071DDAFE|nr:uncharacterized protein LOC104585532 isoform X3 [Brachypodium distachyon]|eukprot:XP_014758901.1 uncharacterized protein LOC104585532 isoform X3 [Brachypodium distachyon]